MRENSVRELHQDDTININHIAGGNNNFDVIQRKIKMHYTSFNVETQL